MDAEIADLPDRPSAAIEALRIVQEHRGWVSDESLNAIARHLNMAAAELDSVATFYNLIFRKPVGRHVIMVCDSISCFIMGCDKVRQRLSDELGIEPGETTEDGRFTLLPIVCLGACDKAPTMTIDEELFGQVDPAELPAILERFE
ncbi:MAG: NADH-quinone oxidoreductase subunit NuoE [Gammaproteobacteria bacterium]